MQKTKEYSQTERETPVAERPGYESSLRAGLLRQGHRSFGQDSVPVLKDDSKPVKHTPAPVEGKAALLKASWRQCCSFYWHL